MTPGLLKADRSAEGFKGLHAWLPRSESSRRLAEPCEAEKP
jgi:hypothetical protein